MSVEWCGACAAPLPPGPVVVCRYCECTNTRGPDHSAIFVAAEEARALAAGIDARIAPLQEELDALTARVSSDPSVRPEILDVQERILRLTFVPTLHFAKATDSWEEMRQSVETIIRDSKDAWRQAFDSMKADNP